MERLTELARLILAEAEKLGADYAQCEVAESEKREFNVDGGRFSLMRTLFDREVSVTVLKEQRKGSVGINRFDEESVRAAVADSLAACESAEPDPAWEFDTEPREESFTDGCPDCDEEALFMRTRELLRDVNERHPKIMMEQMITEHDAERRVYMNSAGVVCKTTSGWYDFELMYSAHEGEKGSSFYGSSVRLQNLDKPVIDCAFIEKELADVEKQIETKPMEGKFVGTVLLAPMALAEIVLSTVSNSFLSDAALIDGTSIWKDKLGEQVADPGITVSLQPRCPDVVCGQRYTGEGYAAEDFDVIREGKLQSFLLSQYGANRVGGKRAPANGSNVTMAPGAKSLEEIIGGIERGVLVMRFSGGEPAASGEFAGVAKNSFLIENGRVTDALAETMISGCVPDMLMNVRAVSSDVLKDGTMVLPYVAFDGVTVSGR
ncbi:MAG: TldD/PmbA family protein [Oscillospiraceae bacterium]|nr:TldD/PmbA family protein [Oscillospiraceae bacterium]